MSRPAMPTGQPVITLDEPAWNEFIAVLDAPPADNPRRWVCWRPPRRDADRAGDRRCLRRHDRRGAGGGATAFGVSGVSDGPLLARLCVDKCNTFSHDV